jgi:hypothetical protein
VIAAVGVPVVVIPNENAVPAVAVAEDPLVTEGVAPTVIVNVCVVVPVAFFAVRVSVKVPLWSGSPRRIPPPVPPIQRTPRGRVPVLVTTGAGVPVAVTLKR